MTFATDVLIAGGGVAGLACAAALAGIGLRVQVFERDAWLGGRAASWTDAATGDIVDIGPHVLTSEHRNFIALLERVGTAGCVQWQSRPLITLLDAGRALRMEAPHWPPPLHGLPNLRNALRCVSLADLMSNRRIAWQAARLDEAATLAFDSVDALGHLRRMGVSERFIDWFWHSAVMALLNVPLAACSAAAMLRVFRLLLGRSGYRFGFPRVGLAALFAPGCQRIVEAAGGAVFTRRAVQAPLVRDGRFAGFVLRDGTQVAARAGVLALPPQAIAAMAADGAATWLGRPAAVAHRFEPSPYVSTMLWFDRKLTRERFWARVAAPQDLNTDFYDLSNIRPGPPNASSLIASNAIHAQAAWRWSDEELIARTRHEIAEFAPSAASAHVLHARVHRIPMAVPCPAPGSEALRPDGRTGLQGLRLAGDWTATALPCSMESAARSAALAAEGVAADLGRSLSLARPTPETTGLVGLLRRRSRG